MLWNNQEFEEVTLPLWLRPEDDDDLDDFEEDDDFEDFDDDDDDDDFDDFDDDFDDDDDDDDLDDFDDDGDFDDIDDDDSDDEMTTTKTTSNSTGLDRFAHGCGSFYHPAPTETAWIIPREVCSFRENPPGRVGFARFSRW